MNNKNDTSQAANLSDHNYGVDALRMLAMLMVVIAHVLGPGGILEAANPMSAQYETAWFLEAAACCSVNCYALISGYVGIYSKYKYQNIIMLWLRVVFYTLSITLLFSILLPDVVSAKDWIKALLPVTEGYYWYVSAYFALFIFIPVLNIAVNKLTQKQYQAIVIGLILVFSCLQTLFSKEIFGTSSNAWWLIILYIIGGYIRKYRLFPKSGAIKMLGAYILTTTFTWLSKVLIESESCSLLRFFDGKFLFINTSITLLLAGIFLLLMFERVHFSHKMVKIIHFFSPMAFSVYLIHAHPFVWDYFLTGRFAWQANLSVPLEILSILLTALFIYTTSSIIDLIRIGIFKGLKLKKYIGKIEDKYWGNLWN